MHNIDYINSCIRLGDLVLPPDNVVVRPLDGSLPPFSVWVVYTSVRDGIAIFGPNVERGEVPRRIFGWGWEVLEVPGYIRPFEEWERLRLK